MSKKPTRTQIIETADTLFYEKGYEQTSFADIADVVAISRGNFYHHFKTKDEILEAVIALRLANTQTMLDGWAAQTPDPKGRILQFVRILIVNQSKIMAHGCPVGTLCAELAKLDHGLHGQAAQIFTLFRTWLAQQFAALGHGYQADHLAMHLLGRSQGVAALANAFRDDMFVKHEVEQMAHWLETLQPER
jgi:TetR/AcrR family transcriptional regulator, transcriptional repressor for nem operon